MPESEADDTEIDPTKFKEMLRLSANDFEDSLNRSQDFLGQEPQKSPRRSTSALSPTKHKWGKPISPEQCRPDDWLGSPTSGKSKRKSYRIKSKSQAPGLVTDSTHSVPATMRGETLGSPPLLLRSNSTPTGLGVEAPDPSQFKDMLRESIHEEMPARPDEFLGAQKKVYKTFHSAGADRIKPKWGEQNLTNTGTVVRKKFKKKTMAIGVPSLDADEDDNKAMTRSSVSDHGRPSKSRNSNRATSSISDHGPSTSKSNHSPDPEKYKAMLRHSMHQEEPIVRSSDFLGDQQASMKPFLSAGADKIKPKWGGDNTPNSSNPGVRKKFKTMKALRPPDLDFEVDEIRRIPIKSASMGMGTAAREPKVDRKKFIDAFTTFEGRESVPTKKRNFTVSKEARAKSALISSSHHGRQDEGGMGGSSHHGIQQGRNLVKLNDAIVALREIALSSRVKKSSTAEQHAFDILQMFRHLKYDREIDVDQIGCKTYTSIINGLRRNGLLQTKLKNSEVEEVHEITEKLDELAQKLDDTERYRLETEICSRILHQVSTTSPRSLSILEDVIGRLRQVQLELPKKYRPRVEKWIQMLIDVDDGVKLREGKELATVIEGIDSGELDDVVPSNTKGVDEVTRILGVLDDLAGNLSNRISDFMGPSGSPDWSPASRSPRGCDPTISPSSEAKRNFKISSAARAKSLAVSQLPLDLSSHHDRAQIDKLQTAISNLKRVVVPTKGNDRSENQASEIMQMRRHLRKTGLTGEGATELYGMIDVLWDRGFISSNLGPNRMEELQKVINMLNEVRERASYDDKVVDEIATVLKLLRRLTPTSAGAIDTIQPVIGRLKKVLPHLRESEKDSTEGAISRLEAILKSMQEGQEQQLAEVLRQLNTLPDLENNDDIMTMIGSLGRANLPLSEEAMKAALAAKKRLTPSDADHLVQILVKLKRAKMSHREAKATAAIVRHLKWVSNASEEKISDKMIGLLTKHFKSKTKAKQVSEALKELRTLELNEHERMEVAAIVRSLDKGKQGQNKTINRELSRLRQLHLTHEEAKAASEVVAILGKSRSPTDDISDSEEMTKLRKLGIDEKADVVEEVYKSLSQLDLESDDIEEIVRYIVDLGVEPLGPSELKLISTEYEDGKPIMILNIPDGEEYALSIANLDLADHICKQKQYKTRECRFWIDLEPLDDDSDEFANDNSDYELESDEDGDESDFEIQSPSVTIRKTAFDSEKAEMAKTRLPPQDADKLIQKLLKLKKAKMSHPEATATSNFIRKFLNADDEDFGEACSKLGTKFKSQEKAKKVASVLNELRKLNLNEAERVELAAITRYLGKGKKGKMRDEIRDALVRLRKISLSPKEAKEVAGIMFNLRKVRPKGYDFKDTKEMKNLRRVLADSRADVVAELYNDLNENGLTKSEIDEFVGCIIDLGVQLDSDEFKLFMADFVNGKPLLVLSIPDGETYANSLSLLGTSKHISKKKQTTKTREFHLWIDLEPSADDSDELVNEESSDVESESDEESKKQLTSSKKPVLTPKAARKKSVKKLHHYNKGQADAAKADLGEEDSPKRIRYSNKHQWRHKKHHATVVNEKRWRFEEDFNADEVIWSPLSRDQYDRRKTVGASILKTLDKFAPIDDMVLDEFEEVKDGDESTPKKKKGKSKSVRGKL